jgi:hypothetical protein
MPGASGQESIIRVMDPLADAASRLGAVLGLVALLFALASCGGGQSAQPIEGYWSWEGDGVQQVKSLGSGNFQGTVVQAASIGQCAAPVGRVVLRLHGSGNRYGGQDEWFRDSDCARRFSADAVVDIINGSQTAHLCSTGPFTDVAPVSNCVDLKRMAKFKPK